MNREQIEYDADVQKYNRDATIRAIENKLDMLKQIKAIIYAESQRDKIENGRRTTLLEYHKRLDEYDAKIDEQTAFVDKMKAMNGYIPRKVSVATAPQLGVVVPLPGSRVRSKSSSRIKNRHPTPRYPLDPEQLKQIAKVILESKLSDSAETYDWVESSPYLIKLEKIKDANVSDSEIPEESELNEEIAQTEKELNRARCCFGF
jgi:hypothetical protein